MIHGLRVHGFKAAFDHLACSGSLRHHSKLFQIRQRNRRRSTMKHARKIRPHRHGSEWGSILLWNGLQSAIQPAVFRGFQSRRAGFHEVLRIKVRARRIG